MQELLQSIAGGASTIVSLLILLVIGIIIMVMPLGRAESYKWVFGVIIVIIALVIAFL